jgi:hypothetical protein
MKKIYRTMISGLKNEIAIDAFLMINTYGDRNFNIPVLRPIMLMRKIKSNLLLKIILYSLSIFWIVIFPVLMLYKLVKYLYRADNQNININNATQILVATSSRIATVSNGADENLLPEYYISVPWLNINIDKKEIKLLNLLSITDLIRVFFKTIKGLTFALKDIKHPIEVLQTYVLFEYFMLSIGLEKLKQKGIISYWYSNHYDRWSVLFDLIGENNVLLQHGFVSEKFKLPYRLKNIKRLYYIDKKSINIFKNNIINFRDDTEVIQLKNTLKIQSIKNKNKAIFLISSPAQLEFDIELIELLKKLDIIIYIKPHPLFDKKPYRKVFGNLKCCILIEDNEYYPDVDIIISGYSTLAVEYELLNKKITWIPSETKESIFEKLKYLGDDINV